MIVDMGHKDRRYGAQGSIDTGHGSALDIHAWAFLKIPYFDMIRFVCEGFRWIENTRPSSLLPLYFKSSPRLGRAEGRAQVARE